MPGCLHRDDFACPLCRSTAAAALLLGLTAGLPGCAGGGNALYGMPEVDDDNDGYSNFEDCDDSDASIYPGADDPEGDGIDQNCDGVDGIADSGM
ncbi:MAG: hypothetical protein EP330_10225 [Deltaproteobacteria bacterium]|nr:MAG: hypothetical protein EP330_10225 [Deltaproteobacteria bacterium]